MFRISQLITICQLDPSLKVPYNVLMMQARQRVDLANELPVLSLVGSQRNKLNRVHHTIDHDSDTFDNPTKPPLPRTPSSTKSDLNRDDIALE